MSLLDKASLIVTPNSYKESKLYSVVPNTTLGDMDVVRATTATRVNSAGLIEVVPRNLLTYSNTFNDASWLKSGVTITANTTIAPNGTTTASKIVENGTLVTYGVYKGITTGFRYSHSIYAKKGERDWIKVNAVHGGNQSVWFNLANGTIGTNNTTGTPSIENVGNGWYRCAVNNTDHSFAASFFSVMPCTNNNVETYTGTVGNGIFIWGAQLENFATATEYFPTTTRLNIPRIDYTNGSCPSLLVEPQRTNILTYSEALTPNYTFYQCSITSNQISPNGTNNAKRITNGATATDVYFEQSVGITLNSYTWSAFVKKGTDNSATIKPVHVGIGGDVSLMTFTFATETIVTSGAITTSGFTKLTNGWYRIFCTVPITLAVISLRGRFGNSNTANVYNEWYGVQLEVGSYPTSYIPTVASTVTRNADVISKTGISSLIGQTEGVFFVEMSALTNTQTAAVYMSVFASGTNFTSLGFITGTNKIVFEGIYGGVSILYIYNAPFNININSKIAVAYQLNKITGYVNGIKVFENTTPQSFSQTLTQFKSDYRGLGNFLEANVKSIQLYKTRLTDTELAQLTTL